MGVAAPQRLHEGRLVLRRHQHLPGAAVADAQPVERQRGRGQPVPRRLDRPETYGPLSYEVGSAEDPDWAEADPGEQDPGQQDSGQQDSGS